MENEGVQVDYLRLVDFNIAYGVQPDMMEAEGIEDEWPSVFKRIEAANILVIGTPIWLGEKSSIAQLLIERLYSMSGKLNEKGQYLYYGKTGGCIITGNEDGVKHCAMGILYALQHIGYSIPPQADCGWLGEIGPGPSYLDENSGGSENEFTQRNTTFMTYNLIHMASLMRSNDGFPAYGNVKSEWDDGKRWGLDNPEYR